MKNRCYNPKFKQYEDYGGRGIRVCEEWLDIRNFIKWVDTDSNWEEGLSLDRIDNDKEYSPDNCTFSTRTASSIVLNVPICFSFLNICTLALQARDNYIIQNNLPHKLSKDYVKEIK